MTKIIRNITVLIFTLMAVLFILGCAGNSKDLLAENYKSMNNENLLRYYYTLNDEIERQEKQSGPQLGIGIGGFGHHTGGGVGVQTGGSGYTADDLRARRIDVRMELKRRGLNP
ncbi:MAG: hypothetical protein WC373_10210 [Smithella sp.]|jgi:hypothetical protein